MNFKNLNYSNIHVAQLAIRIKKINNSMQSDTFLFTDMKNNI